MQQTIVEQLADFTRRTRFQGLPGDVVDEVKRLLLDSIGCALAAVHSPKGSIAIDCGRQFGRGVNEASIIGAKGRTSIFGAAFANAELINALDFDAVLYPGHVVPYVLPPVLALAEKDRRSGRDVITAVAVAHEMSYRIGRAMDYLRDINDGQVSHPPVFGYSCTVFGATAAIGFMLDLDAERLGHAISIAAYTAPVNSLWSGAQRNLSPTIKYCAGTVTQTAFTAALLAEGGHRGDPDVLDDADFGYARFVGTSRWESQAIVEALGTEWRFPAQQAYKMYPHCRVPAALLDALEDIMKSNGINPSEIDSIEAWVEPHGMLPLWTNRQIEHPTDAQFSIAHGLAVGAHCIRPRRNWQDPAVMFDPSVLALMDRVTIRRHPEYEAALAADPRSRPSRLEVRAGDRRFVDERQFPRGGPSPDRASFATTADLVDKFRENAEGVLTADAVSRLADGVLGLEDIVDFSKIMALTESPA